MNPLQENQSMRKSDDYDAAIEFLTANPDKIYGAWVQPYDKPGGCLFLPLGPTRDGHMFPRHNGVGCGCPTICRNGKEFTAATSKLVEAANAADIPTAETLQSGGYTCSINVNHLSEFARLQRLADQELGGDLRPASRRKPMRSI